MRIPIAVIGLALMLGACGQTAEQSSGGNDTAAAEVNGVSNVTGGAALWAGGAKRPLEIQNAHPNGVVLQLTSLQSGPTETTIGVRVINGRDKAVDLNRFNNSNGYLVLDTGEKLYLSPPASNAKLSIEAGQTLEGQLVFLGRLPKAKAAVLVLNENGQADSEYTNTPELPYQPAARVAGRWAGLMAVRSSLRVALVSATLMLAGCGGSNPFSGDPAPLNVQIAHPNGVVLQLLSAGASGDHVVVNARVMNGRDREVMLTQGTEKSYLLTGSGEKLFLVPPAANESLAIPAGQIMDMALVFAGKLAGDGKATLVLNENGDADGANTSRPRFQVVLAAAPGRRQRSGNERLLEYASVADIHAASGG